MADEDLVTSLRQAGVNCGDLVGLVISPVLDLGLATADRSWPVAAGAGLADEVGQADEALRPRWVVWSGQTAARLIERGPAGDMLGHHRGAPAAVRRLAGQPRPGLGPAARAGHRDDAADGPLDLFGMDEGDGSDPVAPDGHLLPEWVSGGWSDSPSGWPGGRRWPARWPGSAGGAGRAGGPADGPGDGPLRIHRRTAVRGALRRRATHGPGGRGTGPDPLYRSPAAQRGRRRGPEGGP